MVSINISDIMVKLAQTPTDFNDVIETRWEGYKKYLNNKNEIIDEFDYQSNSSYLLAVVGNTAVGTMRILDQKRGKIEVENFKPINSLLTSKEQPCAEATRFSIPPNKKSRAIKFALWKGFYLYCLKNNLRTALVWVRSSAARDYERLLFKNIGTQGVFHHPKLGSLRHYTYKLDINNASNSFKSSNHPLYEFFFEITHPNICI